MPLQPIGRLYWENSGLSEISTQNIRQREHSWVLGWGIRYPCHWRARSLGSKRPSGIYSRRDVFSDHISGYVGKTLVFEKYGYKDDRKWKFLYSIAMCRYQLGLVSHRTPPSLGSSRPSGAYSQYKCLYSP